MQILRDHIYLPRKHAWKLLLKSIIILPSELHFLQPILDDYQLDILDEMTVDLLKWW